MDKKGAGSKKTGVTRRQFLTVLGAAAAGGLLTLWERLWRPLSGVEADAVSLTPQAYLPYVARDGTPPTPTPTLTPTPIPPGAKPRVVRVHDAQATSWDFESGWYGDYVDIARVEAMMVRGLTALTGMSTASAAWAQLLPGYATGKIIAIKISLNNASGCDDDDNQIDALPQTLIALTKTLTEAGVDQHDIWFYDATKENARRIPTRLSAPVWDRYPNVRFFGKAMCGAEQVDYDMNDDDLRVDFTDLNGNIQPRWLTPILKMATYLINVPLFKYHGIHPVSLGFKNHFGSINRVDDPEQRSNDLHSYIRPSDSYYSSTYSPLVDVYRHPYIKDKTVLTIGDALFGAFGAQAIPEAWGTFENTSPNSLFFALDPVALDCVMTDFIRAESAYPPHSSITDAAYDYLFLAQSAGLGVCEGTPSQPGGDPWGTGYTDIDYLPIEM